MSTATDGVGTADTGKNRAWLAWLQKLGRSLMLPIAALPVAGLLLRLGQDDLLGKDGLHWNAVASVVGAAGGTLFDNLPLLFALGVAIGMAKKADGSTALAGLVGYLVYKAVGDAMSPLVGMPVGADGKQTVVNYGVLGGILVGIIAAYLWQRFHRVKLPPYLAFFGGRRFVPIITALATMILAVLMAFIYEGFNHGLSALGVWSAQNSVVGGFVYGTVNRLLIPLGLHHIINTTVWFQVGDCVKAGAAAHGDLTCFFATQGAQGGTFMTGFFPIMMFALPGAALAIWRNARPEARKITGGLMLSTALTAFLTGVTEPLEFSFMFVAWPLYIVHAVLTGTSLALVNALGIRDGFTFSAGLFDYILNFGIATKPLLLIVIGLGYGVIYYFLFSFMIKRMNLKTPGREDPAETRDDAADATTRP
ncbi:PTS transporter subunit EIIC [Raineyella sp.]|uniref:PTS system glucose-specific EIICB component n=1 Tax=bioreactor metagenome TaxID=1076179 RepID=A0A645CAC7_9ZZZZ|nr:PTS transporter subunit EIIC [Raineyella sp.]MEA5153358.1 PTS transporter subunit EIIC [Raineyella sp.]